MFEAVGHAVSRLIRIRYGAMVLPRGLKRGACMELDDADINALMQAAGSAQIRGSHGAHAGQGANRIDGSGPDSGARRRGKAGRGGTGPRSSNAGARHQAASPLGGAQGPSVGANGGRRQRGDASEQGDRQAAASQPDPMKTAFGYIGADSFTRQRQDQGQRRGGTGGSGGGGPRRSGRGR